MMGREDGSCGTCWGGCDEKSLLIDLWGGSVREAGWLPCAACVVGSGCTACTASAAGEERRRTLFLFAAETRIFCRR